MLSRKLRRVINSVTVVPSIHLKNTESAHSKNFKNAGVPYENWRGTSCIMPVGTSLDVSTKKEIRMLLDEFEARYLRFIIHSVVIQHYMNRGKHNPIDMNDQMANSIRYGDVLYNEKGDKGTYTVDDMFKDWLLTK